jgi:hypothetical protein
LSNVSSSKAISLRTRLLLLRQHFLPAFERAGNSFPDRRPHRPLT